MSGERMRQDVCRDTMSYAHDRQIVSPTRNSREMTVICTGPDNQSRPRRRPETTCNEAKYLSQGRDQGPPG